MARSVPAVVRALDVLELFLDGRSNLSAPEVAIALGLPRTTVHELLATLVEREYVERLPDNAHRFRLGLRVFELGNSYAECLDVVRDGQSVVDEVAARCGETCQLAVLDGRDVVYVAKADGSHDLRVQAPIGRRFTALRTAAGRVLLAHLPWSDLDRRFPVRPIAPGRPGAVPGARVPMRGPSPLRAGRPEAPGRPETSGHPPHGEGLPVPVAAENDRLRRELASISQRGVGADAGGKDAVVRSVAAAIRDHLGHVIAAVEISVPVSRWDPQRFATLEGLVRRAAARASSRLGYRPPRVSEASVPVAAANRPRRPVTTSRLDPRELGARPGPDARYEADPRYGSDPRYEADPRYGSDPRYAAGAGDSADDGWLDADQRVRPARRTDRQVDDRGPAPDRRVTPEPRLTEDGARRPTGGGSERPGGQDPAHPGQSPAHPGAPGQVRRPLGFGGMSYSLRTGTTGLGRSRAGSPPARPVSDRAARPAPGPSPSTRQRPGQGGPAGHPAPRPGYPGIPARSGQRPDTTATPTANQPAHSAAPRDSGPDGSVLDSAGPGATAHHQQPGYRAAAGMQMLGRAAGGRTGDGPSLRRLPTLPGAG